MEGRRWEVGGERWKVEGGYELVLCACASVCVCGVVLSRQKPLILLRESGQTGFSVLLNHHSVSQLYDAMTKKTWVC